MSEVVALSQPDPPNIEQLDMSLSNFMYVGDISTRKLFTSSLCVWHLEN